MATISIRVDDDIKQQAEFIFDELGISMSSALTMFLKQTIRYGGIPFELKIDPFYASENQARLRKAIKDMDAGKGEHHDLIETDDE